MNPKTTPETLAFIVGMPRSGTTALLALLNQHPSISLMNEAGFLLFPHRLCGRYTRADWLERLDYYNNLLDKHGLAEHTNALQTCRNARDAAMTAYADFARQKPLVSVGGEKMPTYGTILPRLMSTFPKARIICCWRDPAEVIRSLNKLGEKDPRFRQPGYLAGILHTCQMLIGYLVARPAPNPVLHVSFARLMRDSDAVLSEIFAFLGLPPYAVSIAQADARSFTQAGEQVLHETLGSTFKQIPPETWLRHHALGYLRPVLRRHPEVLELMSILPEELDAMPRLSVWNRFLIRGRGVLHAILSRFKTFLLSYIPLPWWRSLRSRRILAVVGEVKP